MPLRHKHRILGVLYLENNLVTDAFTPSRVETLGILLGHAAVSLENARLFAETRRFNEQLDTRVRQRTAELEQAQKKLVYQAHQAGMAATATSVLHNVGNILNSVITSGQLLKSDLEGSRLKGVARANALLRSQMDRIGDFLANDPRGERLLHYYLGLEKVITREHDGLDENVTRLIAKIESIKDVITAQQSYAAAGFRSEHLPLGEVIADTLVLQAVELEAQGIRVETLFESEPAVAVEKVKLMHVLFNLLKNAAEAMKEARRKHIRLRLTQDEAHAYIRVSDSGCGIPPERLRQIFTYGYTSKEDGHGFGLHGSANAMTEMGAALWAESEGKDKGATFVLRFPLHREAAQTNHHPRAGTRTAHPD